MTTTAVPATAAAPTAPTAPSQARQALSGRWPLAAAGAGLAAFVFTTFSSRLLTETEADGDVQGVYAAVENDGLRTHLGVAAAFVCVLLLAVFAAGFGRFLTARAPEGSLPAQVARLGLGATVATVALAGSLKAIYRGGLPDHMDSPMYTEEAVVVLQIVVDQYQWAAYWTLALAMGAVAVLGLKDRVLPKWYAVLSTVLTVFVLGMTLVLGLPYSAGVIAPVWLVATTVALLRLHTRLA
jgi:hypothetical protein